MLIDVKVKTYLLEETPSTSTGTLPWETDLWRKVLKIVKQYSFFSENIFEIYIHRFFVNWIFGKTNIEGILF